jgi:hypothetical protein
MKGPPKALLPKGYRIGMRVHTNETYAAISRRAPYLEGIIVGGSHSANGDLVVKWDSYKRRCIVPHKLVSEEGH